MSVLNSRRSWRAARWGAVLGIVLALIVGCSSSGGKKSGGSSGSADSTSATIGAARCKENKAAGTINYLTTFDLGGGFSILNSIAALKLGYFKQMCLNVDVRPRASAGNAQLLGAGTAQIAGFGSASEVMTAIAANAKITGIATYAPQSEVVLMTRPNITSLSQLKGKTIGYKAFIQPAVRLMLANQGISESSMKFVSVGFDPTIIKNKVEGLIGYRDNELLTLESMGYKPHVFNPTDFGVKGTYTTLAANTAWANKNPTAVEDFLRAAHHAIAWIQASKANLTQAIAWSQSMSPSGYNAVAQTRRWTTDIQIVTSATPPGQALGTQSTEQWTPESQSLVKYKLIKKPVDPATAQTDKYIQAIYKGTTLIWPAPGASGH